MDEIDAALDFRNVSIVANYIKDRTKNAQFIIISLRYVHGIQLWSIVTRLMRFGSVTTCSSSVTVSSASTRLQTRLGVRFRPLTRLCDRC